MGNKRELECLSADQIKSLVIQKLRILGFQGVSEKSLVSQESHKAMYIHALESELLKLNEIQVQFLQLLEALKNQKTAL